MNSIRGANALTARWAREVCRGETGALSGAGVWPLLALLAAAARGRGREELAAAAGVGADGAERHAHELLAVLQGSTAADAALGVWNRADLPLERWWLEAVPEAARGVLAADPAEAQGLLNAWVRRHTRDRLTRMPIQVRPDTLLVLATALSVETRWRYPFQDRPLIPAGPWAAPMRKVAGLSRFRGDVDDLAVARTPAGPITLATVEGEDDVDVILCLGDPECPPGEVIAGAIEASDGRHPLSPGRSLVEGGHTHPAPGVRVIEMTDFAPGIRLTLHTVRFEVNAQHDLMEHAGLFGLETVTTADPQGHFPGISRVPLMVSQAAQDITATFSAEGFKAAAVTAFGGYAAGVPMERSYVVEAGFNRPFGFVARHRPTGLVLLAGWVAEPQEWPEDVGNHPW